MKLWRLHVRPSADEGSDPVEVCLKKKIIGIGWRVDRPPKGKEDYWNAGEKRYGNKGWSQAANVLLYRMEQGDLVWFRSRAGLYYLARIRSDWRYSVDPTCNAADLFNVRDAEIYEAGTRIAGKVIACFRPAATAQNISSDTALVFSMLLFNRLAKRDEYHITETLDPINIFDLLTDVELEDVVGLYLQLEQGYAVIPSSREYKGTTPGYEFELLSRANGEPAYVQVRSGDVKIDLSRYSSFRHPIYLFSPAGYYGRKRASAIPLERETIERFIFERGSILPQSIRVWVDYCDQLKHRK